jgi:hypothetical protein
MTICANEDCKKKASFNVPGEKAKAKYCGDHKTDDMDNLINIKCKCGLGQPKWNYVWLKPEYCGKCKKDDMIEQYRKKCSCGIARPCFNYPGEKAEFCNTCKSINMINVLDKRCECGKATSPLYNFEDLKGKFCVECKTEGMIDVRNPVCACGNRMNFNYDGLKPKYCKDCLVEGMIDVTHDRCLICKKSQPTFNYAGLQPKYCAKCKNDDMENVKQVLCACGKAQPTFNLEGLQANYCASCRTSDMTDVRHKKCKTLYCDIRVEDKYMGYCLRCFIYTFPDRPVAKNYKTKEVSVSQHVLSIFPNFTWLSDKTIQDGCSLKRPDLFLDLGYQVIIVEIDENQHKSYDCSCQNKRIMEISQDVGHRPIVFIRFNPDAYIMNNEIVSSCWELNIKGICVIKPSKNKEWISRINILQQQITYWTTPENKTDKTIEVVQLYYDQNN